MSNWDFNTVFNRHFDVNGIRDAMQQRFKMLERKFNEEMAAKRQQVDNELAALRKETEKELLQRKKELDDREKEITKRENALKEEKEKMSEMHKIQLGQIKLDVGGEHYTTSLTTLTSAPNSMLAAMFSGRHVIQKNEDGRVFIDRNGKLFQYILDYLRDGDWIFPKDEEKLARLKKEMVYYGLEEKEFDIEDENERLKQEQELLEKQKEEKNKRNRYRPSPPTRYHQRPTAPRAAPSSDFELLLEQLQRNE